LKSIPLHVARRGRGPALMLLHGYTGRGSDLDGLASAFTAGFEVLSPDLPGHGASAARVLESGYDFDACLDDLVATLDSTGHRRAHWLGYSMGARLALGCAVRHPERVASLVLVGGRAGIEDDDERATRCRADVALAERIETGGLEAFVDQWLAQPLFDTQRRLGEDFLAAQRRARLDNDARALAAALRALGPAAQPPLHEALADVRVPVLLVAGALDQKFLELAHALAKRLPQAEVREIPNAGHAVHLEQPEALERTVREFLRRGCEPARSFPSALVQEIES
jgi:2-succinyl-6-hydroxy-2,4-cyclohexadiene-1-carboxylate synthase